MGHDLENVNVNRSVIRQAVVRQASRSPATIACAGAGALTAVLGVLSLGWPMIVAGAVIAPLGFLVNARFRSAQFSEAFMRDVAAALERKRQRRFGEIRADLYDLANELPAGDRAGDLAAEALGQFGHIHDRFDLFTEVLDRKLNPGELAHARYLGAADEYFMKVLEHLGTTVDTLRIAAGAVSDQDRQVQRVAELLEQNAAALAAFDQTSEALAAMPDLDVAVSADLELITSQLDALAEQAERLASVNDDSNGQVLS